MNFIDLINKKSEEHRDVILLSKTTIKDSILLELSKSHPFYGYVDIIIEGVEPFVMFTNNDDVVANCYFWNGANAYESMSLKIWTALAKVSPVVLDIGSYTGVYALAASRSNLKSKVFAFEALDRIYNRLLINKKVNVAGNLQTYNYAVSESEGEVKFNIYSGETVLVTGSSLIDKKISREIYEQKKVKTIAIDDFLKNYQITKVGLIKIDAEGAEHLVLKGGKDIIKRDCPDMIIELLKDADLKSITEVLSCCPYNFYQINDATQKIESIPTLRSSTDMYNLNTLISCKSENEIQSILSGAF